MRKKTKEQEPRTIDVTPLGDAFIATATKTSTTLTSPPAKEETTALTVPEGKQSPEAGLELAKRRIHQFKGFVTLIASEVDPSELFIFAPKRATEEDLLKLKAYLPLHVCQSILAWSGALWFPDKDMLERRDEDELGKFIEYDQYVDVLTGDGREVRVMGSCSTRHSFHGVAFTFWACPACRAPLAYQAPCPTHGSVKPRKLNAYRPLSDVNRGNVRKHAMTNCFNKAVDALGFTPTLRDLKEANMDITKISRANFGGKDNDDNDDPPQHSPQRTANTPRPTPPPSTASTQAQPSAAQAPSAKPNPDLPKASIPPQEPKMLDPLFEGILQKCQPSTTRSKMKEDGTEIGKKPFLFLEMDGQKFATFDNKDLAVDTRGGKRRAFELLTAAIGKRVCVRLKEVGQHRNVTMYLQIGEYEWDSDGTPILRRGDAYESTDEDFPEGLFRPGER